MTVQAKFRVISVTKQSYYEGTPLQYVVKMTAVKGEPFGSATPIGNQEMTINNPEAGAQFEVGREYLVTYEPA